MVVYNFKRIEVVPSGKDFIDVILSRTQRRTPTIIHKGYSISRIRAFYMRKVKYTTQNFHDKLTKILDDFPKLEEMHPFYHDLLNVLYDKDHYKLALGQLNHSKHLIDQIANDYVRLIKYGDSLYRCKQLKRAALGRMCTLMKGQNASLVYLEQVRQHLSRLPSIDPNTRTLLVCGFPNVGKSSFMNSITRADVDVQPYAFTTKSLFVGHTDYKYLPWQVIDTPGILDHPLEDRNTIEMQSIMALAHLQASVLYFLDISQECGYSIEKQVNLFNSIKPLFANKPLFVVLTKIDVLSFDDLNDKERKMIDSITTDVDIPRLTLSNISKEGLTELKTAACDKLLSQRVERKIQSKKMTENLNRVHVAMPANDNIKNIRQRRPAAIPDSVLKTRAMKTRGELPPTIRTTKDEEIEAGGAGSYDLDIKRDYLLENDEWKYDVMPEIYKGHNVADWLDPEIEAKLDELEREEEELEMQDDAAMQDDENMEGLDPPEAARLRAIRLEKALKKEAHSDASSKNRANVPRGNILKVGKNPEEIIANSNTPLRPETIAERKARILKKRERIKSAGLGGASAEITSIAEGYKDKAQKKRLNKAARRATEGPIAKRAKKGITDRHVPDMKPKHLFSGKRGSGKTDRR